MIPAIQPFMKGLSAPPHPEKPKLKKGLLPLFHSILLTELTFQYRFFYEAHEDLHPYEETRKLNQHRPTV